MDDDSRRRLHLFLQRRALAVRRHDPLAARARAVLRSAIASSRSRTRRSTCSRGCCGTRGRPRPTTSSMGATQAVRRARPGRAREPVQRRQRHLSRTEHATGLLAVQHVDARTRVGDARLRRTARVSVDCPRSGARGSRRCRLRRMDDRRRARDVRLLHRVGRVRRRRALLGHRRPGTGGARRLGASRRSVQRSRAGGQFGRGDCGAGPAAARTISRAGRGEGRHAILAGRTCASRTRCSTRPDRI